MILKVTLSFKFAFASEFVVMGTKYKNIKEIIKTKMKDTI